MADEKRDSLQRIAKERAARLRTGARAPESVRAVPGVVSGARPAEVGQVPAEIDPHIVAYHDPYSEISERYRILGAFLESPNNAKQIRTILVTSANYNEGKTVTAINLSIILVVDRKKKVLLVDADMRKPDVHLYLGMNVGSGLSDVLMEKVALDDVIQETRIGNLMLLPSGKPVGNLPELLTSGKMKQLLEILKPRYDYIIIDSSPVVPVADSEVTSGIVDGVLLVVEAGKTKREVILRAQSLLEEAHARIIGSVLTKVEHPIPEFIYKHL
jgi:capsular exopolysaccharide synthesis family protein